jgi:hypothetical protein
MTEIDDDAMLDAQAAERLIGLRKATLAKDALHGWRTAFRESWEASPLPSQRCN